MEPSLGSLMGGTGCGRSYGDGAGPGVTGKEEPVVRAQRSRCLGKASIRSLVPFDRGTHANPVTQRMREPRASA